MSKVMIDREELEFFANDLALHGVGDIETATRIDALLCAPSGTPELPVKAYYYEAPNEHGGFNKSVGLEVRKTFADKPLVLESDALVQIACLEGEIAKRGLRIVELESRYQRDVYGLNNEGDPIGGDPAGGYANDNMRLRAELAAIKAQEPVAWRYKERADDQRSAWLYVKKRMHIPCGHKFEALYAAPVSETKAQGVVMPEPLMAAITRADDVLHALSNWESSSVKLEQRHGPEWTKEVDAIRRELHTQLARLNAAPVQQVSVPDGWNDGYRAAMNSAASGARQLYVQHCHHHGANGLLDRCKELEQSFIRDADAMLAAAPAAPAADDGLVEALDYQVLFDAIAAATSVYANGAINISVQAFRESLAAALSAGKERE